MIKPASQTPFSALALAELASAPAFRAGVFNVVTGAPAAIGGELTSNPTGAQALVHRLHRGRQAADGAVRAHGEEGLAGARRQRAVHRVRRRRSRRRGRGRDRSKFRNTGQTCVCANRLLCRTASTTLRDEAGRRASQELKVGDGLEAGVDQGPLIDDEGGRQGRASTSPTRWPRARGCCRAARATRSAAPSSSRPCSPTSRAGHAGARHEETFGPVAPLFRFKTEAEAIASPTTPSSASPPTSTRATSARSLARAEALEYGIVGINTGLISTEVAPFGGVKESGLGPRGLEVRHRGVSRGQVPLHRRPLTDRMPVFAVAAA